jgi:hypothetical protein
MAKGAVKMMVLAKVKVAAGDTAKADCGERKAETKNGRS